jgi:hypothetical protein
VYPFSSSNKAAKVLCEEKRKKLNNEEKRRREVRTKGIRRSIYNNIYMYIIHP